MKCVPSDADSDSDADAGLYDPTTKMLYRNLRESRNVIGPAVERGNVSEGTAAGFVEEFAAGDVDLLQGLEAISGEARAHDIQPVEVFPPPRAQEFGGVRPNPGLATEA